jgi:hypothetical protein
MAFVRTGSFTRGSLETGLDVGLDSHYPTFSDNPTDLEFRGSSKINIVSKIEIKQIIEKCFKSRARINLGEEEVTVSCATA